MEFMEIMRATPETLRSQEDREEFARYNNHYRVAYLAAGGVAHKHANIKIGKTTGHAPYGDRFVAHPTTEALKDEFATHYREHFEGQARDCMPLEQIERELETTPYECLSPDVRGFQQGRTDGHNAGVLQAILEAEFCDNGLAQKLLEEGESGESVRARLDMEIVLHSVRAARIAGYIDGFEDAMIMAHGNLKDHATEMSAFMADRALWPQIPLLPPQGEEAQS